MTLVSDIIQRAYRASNLIPLGATPTTAQTTEALNLLNPFLLSCVGNEAGNALTDLNIGGTYDESQLTTTWVPDNYRLQITATTALTFNLDPYPKEGQRFAVVDVGNNFATYNVTINPNGRLLDGSSSASTLNTNGLVKQWMYRADTGDWVTLATLTGADEMPFPVEFDIYFTHALAVLLNPQYGISIAPETQVMLNRARGQIRSRYGNKQEIEPDISPLTNDPRSYGSLSNISDFDTGRPNKWLR